MDINDLPLELIDYIFNLVFESNKIDYVNLSFVCKDWNTFLKYPFKLNDQKTSRIREAKLNYYKEKIEFFEKRLKEIDDNIAAIICISLVKILEENKHSTAPELRKIFDERLLKRFFNVPNKSSSQNEPLAQKLKRFSKHDKITIYKLIHMYFSLLLAHEKIENNDLKFLLDFNLKKMNKLAAKKPDPLLMTLVNSTQSRLVNFTLLWVLEAVALAIILASVSTPTSSIPDSIIISLGIFLIASTLYSALYFSARRCNPENKKNYYHYSSLFLKKDNRIKKENKMRVIKQEDDYKNENIKDVIIDIPPTVEDEPLENNNNNNYANPTIRFA